MPLSCIQLQVMYVHTFFPFNFLGTLKFNRDRIQENFKSYSHTFFLFVVLISDCKLYFHRVIGHWLHIFYRFLILFFIIYFISFILTRVGLTLHGGLLFYLLFPAPYDHNQTSQILPEEENDEHDIK